MAFDVFISYARPDRQRVESLAQVLQSAGYSVWWDHQIAGGATFAADIERALNDSRAIVVAWSVNGVQSEWVLDEASVGKQTGKLVSIQLDATPPPLGFRQYHAIDFSSWEGASDDTSVGELSRSIDRYLGRRLPSEATHAAERVSAAGDAIAVLPLDNFSGDASQQFFSDGIHEALITELSKVRSLKVISRTSSRTYSNTTKPLREIAAELGVSKLIEGSVARFDDQVRISIQLIDAKSDTNLWAETYLRNIIDVLQLQQEVARTIAEQVSVVLSPHEEARLSGAPRVSPAAYEAYLRGMYHWYKITPQDLEAAILCFEKALAEDPDYAPAHAGIAAVWAGIEQMGTAAPRVAGPKIELAVNRAIALDANLAQAQFTNAVFQTWTEWNWSQAEEAFLRAIDLNPNFPDAHAYFAHYLNIVGRFEEAQPHAERSLDLDPFNPLIRGLYAADLWFWSREDDAIDQLQSVLDTTPDHWLGFQIIRLLYHHQSRHGEALEATISLYTTLGNTVVVNVLKEGQESGDYHRAMTQAAEALEDQAQLAYVSPTQIALLYNMGGAVDRTAHWLHNAYELGDPELPYLKHLPRFSPAVLAHPTVKELIDKLNFPN